MGASFNLLRTWGKLNRGQASRLIQAHGGSWGTEDEQQAKSRAAPRAPVPPAASLSPIRHAALSLIAIDLTHWERAFRTFHQVSAATTYLLSLRRRDAALTGGGGKNISVGEEGRKGRAERDGPGKFGAERGRLLALSACEEEAGAKDWGEKMEFDEWGETAALG